MIVEPLLRHPGKWAFSDDHALGHIQRIHHRHSLSASYTDIIQVLDSPLWIIRERDNL